VPRGGKSWQKGGKWLLCLIFGRQKGSKKRGKRLRRKRDQRSPRLATRELGEVREKCGRVVADHQPTYVSMWAESRKRSLSRRGKEARKVVAVARVLHQIENKILKGGRRRKMGPQECTSTGTKSGYVFHLGERKAAVAKRGRKEIDAKKKKKKKLEKK